MKYDVWVHLRIVNGWKKQYFGIVESDPGDIVDALRVLFGIDMCGATIEPLHCGEYVESEDD